MSDDPNKDVKSNEPLKDEPKSIDDLLSKLSPEARKAFEETQSGLLSALEKERDANKEMKKRSDALEKAAQEAEKKRLEESNNYKELYEKAEGRIAELSPKAEKLEIYEAALKETLAVYIQEIPEDRRGLIPTELSTEQQLKWISKNRALLSKSKAFDIGAGERGGGEDTAADLTDQELQIAKDYGMKPEEYAKFKDKPKS